MAEPHCPPCALLPALPHRNRPHLGRQRGPARAGRSDHRAGDGAQLGERKGTDRGTGRGVGGPFSNFAIAQFLLGDARRTLMRIIDTHLHLIYPDRLSYPWLGNNRVLNRPWTVDSYWAEAKPLGIEAALHMEVDVAPADIEHETAFVKDLPGIVGDIAACRPEQEDFPAQLDRLLALGNGRIKGLRRILHEVPDDVSQPALFSDNLKRL